MPRSTRTTRADPLAAFEAPTREWFEGSFERPTDAQAQGWPAIAAGEHTLICAPTGSGKTLAAFLWCLDRLLTEEPPADPQDAAARALRLAAQGAGPRRRSQPALTAGRHRAGRRAAGCVRRATCAWGCAPATRPAQERRAFGRKPPDILVHHARVAVPASSPPQAREALRNVHWVILDEIHALAGTKRGAHLALSLERLETLTRDGRRSASGCRPRSDRCPRWPPTSAAASRRDGRRGRRRRVR